MIQWGSNLRWQLQQVSKLSAQQYLQLSQLETLTIFITFVCLQLSLFIDCCAFFKQFTYVPVNDIVSLLTGSSDGKECVRVSE